MNAGRLRHRVGIQHRPEATQAADGEEVLAWVTDREVWAEVKPLLATGRQFVQSQQQRAEVSHQITIRFGPDVRPGDRLIGHDGTRYEVVSAEDADMRRAWLTILTKAVR